MSFHALRPATLHTHILHLPPNTHSKNMSCICALNVVAKAATTGAIKIQPGKKYADIKEAVKAGAVAGCAPFPEGVDAFGFFNGIDAREAQERGGRDPHRREAGVGGRAGRGISDERGSRGGPRRARDRAGSAFPARRLPIGRTTRTNHSHEPLTCSVWVATRDPRSRWDETATRSFRRSGRRPNHSQTTRKSLKPLTQTTHMTS